MSILQRWTLLALVATTSAQVAYICDPTTCLNGTNALSAGATLPSVQLLPGTYSSISAPFSQPNGTLSSASGISNAVASTGFAVNGQTVSQLPGVVLYPLQMYQGAANYTAPSNPSNTANSSANTSSLTQRNAVTTTANGTLSFLLSSGLQAVLSVPTSNGGDSTRVVAYGSVADVTQWSFGAEGGLVVQTVEGTGCKGGCGIGGVCTPQGTCACSAGFTGARCDTCAPGFFGRGCAQCPSCGNGQVCDDSFDGTGQCVTPGAGAAGNATALTTCNCLNGSCNGGGTCTCSPGWTSAANGTQCAACAPGFFQNSNGDCVSCSPGCLSCSSPQGTCTACASGLRVSATDATACEPAPFTATGTANPQTCVAGFFNADNVSCQACDPSCATCNAVGPGGCTKCSGTGKGLFITPASAATAGVNATGGTGTCVAVDATSGVCTNPSNAAGATPETGVFLFNSAKGACDPAPRLCTAASIPGFSLTSTAQPQPATCSACAPGAVLSQGHCLAGCPAGSFNSNGTCETCDASCASCSGSSTTCTACKDPSQFLGADGRCVSTCPDGTFSGAISANNATARGVFAQAAPGAKVCLTCSGACATCSGSAATCLSCPSSRPVLDSSSGTCSSACPGGATQFFDSKAGKCASCDASCASCSGASSGECLGCKDGSVLQGGKCVPAQCQGGRSTVAGFGVCLETLLAVVPPPTLAGPGRHGLPLFAILLLVFGVIILLGLALAFWRIRQVRKRKGKTQRFGDEVYTRSTDVKLKDLNINIEAAAPRSPELSPRAAPQGPPRVAFVLPLRRDAETSSTMSDEKIAAWSRSASPEPSRYPVPMPMPVEGQGRERQGSAVSSFFSSSRYTPSQVQAASLHRSISERSVREEGSQRTFASNNPFRR